MASGAFRVLRAETGLDITAAESAPANAAGMQANLGRVVRSLAVYVDTLTTTGTPTQVRLFVYAHKEPGVVVVLDDFYVAIPLAEPKPWRVHRDVSVTHLSIAVQSLTAGTTPAVTAITARYHEVE